jgi:hypothetical protein
MVHRKGHMDGPEQHPGCNAICAIIGSASAGTRLQQPSAVLFSARFVIFRKYVAALLFLGERVGISGGPPKAE